MSNLELNPVLLDSLWSMRITDVMFNPSHLKSDDIFEENGEGPTDLPSLQAGRLVRGLSGKSRSVLKAILEHSDSSNGFWCEDLASELRVDISDLTGVWSWLTRRIRTVTGSPDAYLIS